MQFSQSIHRLLVCLAATDSIIKVLVTCLTLASHRTYRDAKVHWLIETGQIEDEKAVRVSKRFNCWGSEGGRFFDMFLTSDACNVEGIRKSVCSNLACTKRVSERSVKTLFIR